MTDRSLFGYQTALLVILGLGGAAAALDGQALYYLSPFVAKDLHLTNTMIGLVSSIIVITWAISAYVVGSLSDRTGQRKKYLVWAFGMFAFCSVLSGLATTFMMLFFARCLIGAAEGPVIPVSQSIVMAESTPERRGFNMGVVQNLGAQMVGAMLGPLVIVRVAVAFDWHAAFYLAAIPGLIVAILVALYVREPPGLQTVNRFEPKRSARIQLLELLRHGNVRICMLISSFVIAWYFIVLTYLPLYCVRVLGLTPARMSVVMASIGAAGVLSSMTVPYISDRIGRKPTIAFFSLCGVAAPLSALFVGGSSEALPLMVFLGGMAVGTTPLFMGTIPLETVPPRDAAAASGLVLGVGQVVGGFSGPAGAGILADRFSLAVPLWISVVMALAAVLTSLWLQETAPAKLARSTPRASL